MYKLDTLEIVGASGRRYHFETYSAGEDWDEGIACVYYVSRTRSTGNHVEAIYIGQTADLRDCLANHEKLACFWEHHYNAVSIYREPFEWRRVKAERDLLRQFYLTCIVENPV